VGSFVGPLAAGFIAVSFGWRMPFYILAIPTVAFVLLALRLREPSRTGRSVTTNVPRLREGMRVLWRVPTLRRIWLGVPFLAVAAIGVQFLFSIYYRDIFGVDAGGRGLIQAMDAPFIVAGFIIGMPMVDRGIAHDPGMVMRRIGVVAVVIALLLCGVAAAPRLWVAIVLAYATNTLTVVIVAGGATVISLCAPPEVRARALALFGIFALAGVVTLPVVGAVMDAFGVRWGMAAVAPFLFTGALIVGSSGRTAAADMAAVTEMIES
jgi:MFS family permease